MKIMKEYAKEFIAGVVLALLTISFLLILPAQKALELLVILLAVIASVYLGFALSDGRKREIMIAISAVFFPGFSGFGSMDFSSFFNCRLFYSWVLGYY